LAWVILGVNLLKYPFFVAGARYTTATGESLLVLGEDLEHLEHKRDIND